MYVLRLWVESLGPCLQGVLPLLAESRSALKLVEPVGVLPFVASPTQVSQKHQAEQPAHTGDPRSVCVPVLCPFYSPETGHWQSVWEVV